MTVYDDGYWKRVDGEKVYIVVREGMFLRKVLIRDGKYSAFDNTKEWSVVWKSSKSLESQLMDTLDRYLSEKNSTERQIDDAVNKMNEVYDDGW